MKFKEDYYKLFLSVVLGSMTLSRTYFLLTDPQSTQSTTHIGNGHFLAYIPS
jgi:hypothetical protein